MLSVAPHGGSITLAVDRGSDDQLKDDGYSTKASICSMNTVIWIILKSMGPS